MWSATYEPFGKATITTPSATVDNPTITSNLRLPGQYFDDETGLHYNFRRYYDPSSGRYVTQDPIGLAGEDNLYIYVTHNPLNFFDPTGEFGLVGAGIGAGLDLLMQLAMNGWNLKCVSWTQVGIAGALGAIGGGWFKGAFKHSVTGKKWSQLSQKWRNVSPRYRKVQEKIGNTPDGDWDAHHWSFPRNGTEGPTWRNHPANLNPVPREAHQRLHGNHPTLPEYNPIQKWWYGTPEWAKTAEGSMVGGLGGDTTTMGNCECKH